MHMTQPLPGGEMVNETDGMFVADREVTGLGCVEQFQYCVATSRLEKCYPWSTMFESIQQVYDDLVSTGMDENTAFVNLARLAPPTQSLSVRKYLHFSLDPPDFLVSRVKYTSFDIVLKMDPNEQWIQEVQAWFVKAMLLVRVRMLKIVQNDLAPGQIPLNPIREYSLCDLVLLHDGDYVNIDGVGSLITLALFIFLFLGSYFVPGEPSLGQAMSLGAHSIWEFTKQRTKNFWRWMCKATYSSWNFVKE